MEMQAPRGGNQNRGPQLIALYWAESAVAILVVAARIWGRVIVHQTSYDDYVMLFTLLLLLILAGFITYYASIDGCRHLVYLTPTQRELALKYNWITQPWGIFGFATGKVSVALLLLRIIGPSTIWRKWILYITMVSVTTINILGCIFTFAQCNPPRALWTPHLVDTGQAACWDPRVQSNYAIFLSSWNIVADVILAVLPATIIWGLNLPLRKKLGVATLLGLGLAAAICGIIKVNYLAGLNARSDLTWETYNLFAWSGAELFVIIVCGSIPPIKPVYDRFYGKCGQQISVGTPEQYYGSKSITSFTGRPLRESEYIDLEDQPPPPGTIRKATQVRISH